MEEFAGLTDPTQWLAGSRLALVNGEIMAFRNVVSEGGGLWRVKGLARLNYNIALAEHATGDEIFLFSLAAQELFPNPGFSKGRVIYVKSVPTGIDPSAISGTSYTITGRKKELRPVVNARAESATMNLSLAGSGAESPAGKYTRGRENRYNEIEDVDIIFNYTGSSFELNGAGDLGYGDGVADDDPADIEADEIVIEIWDEPRGASPAHTETVARASLSGGEHTFTITTANRSSWLGGNVDFNVDIYAQTENGAFRSPVASFLVDRLDYAEVLP